MAVAFRFPSLIPTREISDRESSRHRRDQLTVVERKQRRLLIAFVGPVVLFAAMFGATAMRSYIAGQQMHLDHVNSDIARARAHFDELRAERAQLQSPSHLMEVARQQGLVGAVGAQIVSIPADVAAQVAATVGKVDADVVSAQQSQLDAFGHLKATVENTP
jgi:cell division protein FtsL